MDKTPKRRERSLYFKEYYLINKERFSLRKKISQHRYYVKNKEKITIQQKKWQQNNLERFKKSKIEWKKKNKSKIKTTGHIYYVKNKVVIRNQEKKRRDTDIYREKNSNYKNMKWKTDVNFKLQSSLRHRLWDALKHNFKSGSAVQDLGCTIPELKIYLENQFELGMTWQNWSPFGWHIDHKQALTNFDLTDREQFLKACHYTNLQPMWWLENIRKSNKLDYVRN